jgi:hypothetical protein
MFCIIVLALLMGAVTHHWLMDQHPSATADTHALLSLSSHAHITHSSKSNQSNIHLFVLSVLHWGLQVNVTFNDAWAGLMNKCLEARMPQFTYK